jgi:hypothetical protein
MTSVATEVQIKKIDQHNNQQLLIKRQIPQRKWKRKIIKE